MELHLVNYNKVIPDERKWGPRRLKDFEIILVLEGKFRFTNHETGEVVEHNPMEVLLIYPDELHTYERICKESCFFSCIHLLPDTQEYPNRIVSFVKHGAIDELFRRLYHTKHNYGHQRYAEAKIQALLELIWWSLLENSSDTQESLRLEKMVEYLNENLTKQPTRLDLAKEFGLTPQRVNAIFKKELGISPTQYVHKELASKAYHYLIDYEYSVKETSFLLGFESPFYFSKVFKSVYNFPPSKLLSYAKK